MSIVKTGLFLAAVVMLLPLDERKPAGGATTASIAAAATAAEPNDAFCDRNPSTCATGRELWVLFARKAEYGMELGSKLLREQLVRSLSEPQVHTQPQAAAVMPSGLHLPPPAPSRQPATERQAIRFEPARSDATPQPRTGLAADQPTRWR